MLTGYTGSIVITGLSGFTRTSQSPTAQLSTTDIITEIPSTEEIDRFTNYRVDRLHKNNRFNRAIWIHQTNSISDRTAFDSRRNNGGDNTFNRGDRQIPPVIVLTGYTGTIYITELSGFTRPAQSPIAKLSTADINTEIKIPSIEEIVNSDAIYLNQLSILTPDI